MSRIGEHSAQKLRSYRLAHTASKMAAFSPNKDSEARWHNDCKMVYSSEHPALAAWEITAHWQEYPNMHGYFLYELEFDESLVQTPKIQHARLRNLEYTRKLGNTWIAARSSAILRVPSVLIPHSKNYLANPEHPDFDAHVTIKALGEFHFDDRVQHLFVQANNNRN